MYSAFPAELSNDFLRWRVDAVAQKLEVDFRHLMRTDADLEIKQMYTHGEAGAKIPAVREELKAEFWVSHKKEIVEANHLRDAMLRKLGRGSEIKSAGPLSLKAMPDTEKLRKLASELRD